MEKFTKYISTVKKVFKGEDLNSKIEYCFEFVLMDEEMRSKIVNFIKPSHLDQQSYLNLNVVFGVRDSMGQIFLTQSRLENHGMNNEGTGYINVDTYVVITENEVFNAVCTNDSENVKYNIPNGWEDIVIHAIEYFSNKKERDAFEKNLAERETGFSLLRLRNQYKSEMLESIKKIFELENPNVTEDSLKKSCEINSEKDARKFFIGNGCNLGVIEKHYNEATIERFEKYASRDDKYRWVKEEYVGILCEIAEGNIDEFENKLKKANFIRNYWISDDPGEEILHKACQKILEKAELVPRTFEIIASFRHLYFDRFAERVEKIEPLLDLIDSYVENHSEKRYGKIGIPLSSDNYKNDSIRLRGVIAERRRTENPSGFEFVLTDNESIDRILSMFSEVYDTSEEFYSEVVEGLNFSYGVKAKEGRLFLTGLTYGANSIQRYKSFDTIRFAIIIGEDRNVLTLDCERDSSDGSIRILIPYETTTPAPPNFNEYSEILTKMIAFYRNKPERDDFEKKVKEQNPDFNMNRSIHNIPKAIYEKYKDKLKSQESDY
ncbi:hypothetical protein DP73_04730 [Desulfosporosinus sp. HMP52]|uniref:hypothetical protein n=1 Tax=Desulfosporosinus sp. HMP52 TaxID=1487923 RepID=UPI00051FD7E2|nr:hypothetical protein [Desulfosporosinus sp. HMP52]KGK91268.1 hypothetical protein DP73_04730 [Desulfosporosinus sp. HMP52]